jgi:glycosyltransferase involved in cell wall biosynthesis
VYDAHELYHAQIQLPGKARRRYRARECRLIRHADLAITVNPFIARAMADDWGSAAPEVILNAAPVPAVVQSRDQADLRQRLGWRNDDQIVLYQGWFSPERGIDRLVEAARHFPPRVHLVLVGYGDYERELRAISNAQGTDDGRVVFFGRVEPDDLGPLTRSADLGVIPYRGIDLNNYYCSPNKLFEYAVAGLPFICNDLPFLRAMIMAHGFGVIADLDRPDTAARAMLDVMEDTARLRALKASAAEAGRVLNWEIEGKKLVALYERTVGVTAPRA